MSINTYFVNVISEVQGHGQKSRTDKVLFITTLLSFILITFYF